MPSEFLKQHRRKLVLMAMLGFPMEGLADVVVGDSTVTYGVVLSATSAQVSFRSGCDGNQIKSVAWEEVRSILFDEECREHEVNAPTAGLLPCPQLRVAAFKIYPAGGESPIFAETVQLQGSASRIGLFNNEGTLTGPRRAISSIARVRACPTELTKEPLRSGAFCFEPSQIAVNWGLDAAMPNTVFTRGFAVFIQTLPEKTAATELDIRGALGTALIVWTSGLLKHREKVGPTVNRYLQTAVSRSSSFSLLTPPQVIKVACRDNASMVVRVSAARGGDFSLADADYLAKSQIEGRTVLLNAADHRFTYTLTRKVEAGSNDLIWVLAHELGHSFGLPDEYLGKIPSIMNPDSAPREITERDAVALARALEKSVQGTDAGYFNPTRCAGLRRKRSGK